ncbi:sigma-54-dependent Fis family transcriptional regulator [Pontibacillus yanchengensis]|nr:sigma 54-interacting transcriptional regulator [Pontibacillus yanchengensis]
MFKLMNIQSEVQKIAEAIASVLKIEVEIANERFYRVAGTGRTKSGILRKMEGDFVYKSAIRTGGPIIIEEPGFQEVCKRCAFYQHCPETGEICTPIKLDDQVIGVIGLLAFDEAQRSRLFENVEEILFFLNKMADLIASKVSEHQMINDLLGNEEKLTKMINMADEGIMILDQNDSIKELNDKVKDLLHVKNPHEIPNNTIERIQQFIEHSENGEKEKITLSVDDQEKHFFISSQHFEVSQSLYTNMVILKDVNDIKRLADISDGEDRTVFSQIVGNSTQMKELKDYVYKVSRFNSNVLIQGESGTGKEEFAQAIHRASNRASKPFVTVNCGAIPENLLESELFGYDAGAFTGASKNGKKGKFELAEKGTIFLDEISEMPLHLQVKLLRAIQEREIERLGGNRSISIDVRIITATNSNIQQLVEEGTFREDLFYRLNVVPIVLPPLRSRKEDIVSLTSYFISLFNEQFGSSVLGVGQDVEDVMVSYSWPGNIRELKNFVEYLFNFISEGYITLDNAEEYIEKKLSVNNIQNEGQHAITVQSFSLDDMEEKMISEALIHVRQNGGKIEDACSLLGIGRATLFRKINKYNIEVSK